MSAQFVGFINTNFPTTRIVGSMRYKIFPNATSTGVIFYVTLLADTPFTINTLPNLVLRATILPENPSDPKIYQIINPSQTDFPFASSYLSPDGTTRTQVSTSLDQISVFPIKEMQGMLYFSIPTTGSQVVASMYVDLVQQSPALS